MRRGRHLARKTEKVMADFCRQASLELFDQDFNDLAGLCPPGTMVEVLCEDCGWSIVNYRGECLEGELCKHGGNNAT